MIIEQHPNVAPILHRDKEEHGYLKFVPSHNSEEISILQFLGSINSDNNHTARLVKVWPVNGGTIVSMPVLGGHSHNYAKLEENLHSIVGQLVDGVSFMHRYGVAHLDLKPQNILVDGHGQLWIIDFGVSVQVKSIDDLRTGFVGTPGYTAPEVGEKYYSPIWADLWSCGNVIQELCKLCQPSMNQALLLGIGQELMNADPMQWCHLSDAAIRLKMILDPKKVGMDKPKTHKGYHRKTQGIFL